MADRARYQRVEPACTALVTDGKREIENVSGNPQFDYGADLVESGCLFQAVVRDFGFAALQEAPKVALRRQCAE
jgi:hypothetical protein